MAVTGANHIDIPEQFRPKADAGLRDLFTETALTISDHESDPIAELASPEAGPKVQATSASADDLESLKAPEKGMAFAPSHTSSILPEIVIIPDSPAKAPASKSAARAMAPAPASAAKITELDRAEEDGARLTRTIRDLDNFNRGMRAADTGGESSAILSGAAMLRLAEKKHKAALKADHQAFEFALKNAERLEALERELDELYRQRDETLDKIKDLEGHMHMKNGELDWAAYGEEAGIKKKPGETDAEYARRCRKEIEAADARGEKWVPNDIHQWEQLQRILFGWNYAIAQKQKEHDELSGVTNDISKSVFHTLQDDTLSVSERNDAVADKMVRSRQAQIDKVSLEATTPFVDTTQLAIKNDIQNAVDNSDQELENFSRQIVQIEKIPNEIERLKAEKALVDSMSQNAQDVAASDPDFGHIFDAGYFDKLNQPATQVAVSSTVSVSPLTPSG